MRKLIIISILFFLSAIVLATPQDPEAIIYGKDTMYVDFFPFEVLMNRNEELHKKTMNASDCIQSSCWRGHHGTWKIENDSLFLVKLEDGCQEKELNLSLFFDASEISNKGVFAYWFSQRVFANYGKWLDFDEITWSSIYEGTFKCNINGGIISNVRIEMKDPSEINFFIKERIEKEDTMVCLIVEEYPILITDNREYKPEDLKEFILKHIRYPANGDDCMGSVYISFVVEKDGTISNKEFERKLCDSFDEEAMKVIDLMTKWKPGFINDKSVRTKMTLPLRYRYE